MTFDLTVTDSTRELESLIREASTPIIIWSHTGLGQSPIISQIIESLDGKEGRISITDIEMFRDGYSENHKERTPTHIVWEWANMSANSDRIESFFDSIPADKRENLIMMAHPHNKEIGYQLLGPHLQPICDALTEGKTVQHRAYALPDSIMEQSKHIAFLPSAERWLKFMRLKHDGLVVDFIEKLFEKDEIAGYKALFSFYFGSLPDQIQSYSIGLSPSGWYNIHCRINSLGNLIFRGKFENFDFDKAASTERWILEDKEIKDDDRILIGLAQILPELKLEEDFEVLKSYEVRHLWSSVEFFLKGFGVGEFHDQFEFFLKHYYR